jgi:hypothetical protein
MLADVFCREPVQTASVLRGGVVTVTIQQGDTVVALTGDPASVGRILTQARNDFLSSIRDYCCPPSTDCSNGPPAARGVR